MTRKKLLLLLLQHHQLLLLLLLLHKHLLSSLKEPLGIANDLVSGNGLCDATLVGIVFSLLQLTFVHLLIHAMHFSHLLYLVEVDNETALISVVLLNTLPTEHSEMIGAVEVLHSLIMLVTQQAVDAIFILEVDIA